MLTLLHRPGSSAHSLSGENLHFKHGFWWNFIIQKCIKAADCRKAGIDSSDLQFSLQTLCCKGALIVFMLINPRGTSGCSGTFWAPQQQEIFLSGVGKPQAEKSSWLLSRPQGFQNIWYPQAGSTHLQHCAFPVPSTPSQKSHNFFYSDLAQFFSEKTQLWKYKLLDHIWNNDSIHSFQTLL